jgi:hypothetical protein
MWTLSQRKDILTGKIRDDLNRALIDGKDGDR